MKSYRHRVSKQPESMKFSELAGCVNWVLSPLQLRIRPR